MATFLDEIGRAVKQTVCAVVATNDAVNNLWVGSGLPDPLNVQGTTNSFRRQLCDNDSDSPLTGITPPDACGFLDGGDPFTQTGSVDFTPYGGVLAPGIGCVESIDITSFANNGALMRITYNLYNGSTQGPTLVNNPLNRTNWTFGCNDSTKPAPNCSGEIGTYQPTPNTVNITYDNDNSVTVNEDVDVTVFAPQINLTGGIFAPITVAGNTFNLVGTVELTPVFRVNVSPEINVGKGGGNTDSPVPNPDQPIPEPALPEGQRVIIGAIVTATSVNVQRQDFLPQDGNPDIAIPNLGFVSFYISVQNGTAWTEDIPVKNVRSYIPCPVPAGAVDVSGSARSGVQFTVQPVWGYPSQSL